MTTISSVISPEPNIVTFELDSNEPKLPYGYGRQEPIIPPSLNNLNLPHNPFTILAKMGVVQPTARQNDERQPPITAAVRLVSKLDAPDDYQHNWKLGDFFGRQNLQFGGSAQNKMWTSLKFFLTHFFVGFLLSRLFCKKSEKKVINSCRLWTSDKKMQLVVPEQTEDE